MDADRRQVFDPRQPYSVSAGLLPHWMQAGTICFLTWRTFDSMPCAVVARWIEERNQLLQQAGIEPPHPQARDANLLWKRGVRELPAARRWRLLCALMDAFDGQLDACHGECVLRRPELAEIVAESLLRFDGEDYVLTDFVVMPNHLHALIAFHSESAMRRHCADRKRYTGRMINRQLDRTGSFWQREGFDHLVRSPAHFEHYRTYIANNGPTANLPPNAYKWYSKGM